IRVYPRLQTTNRRPRLRECYGLGAGGGRSGVGGTGGGRVPGTGSPGSGGRGGGSLPNRDRATLDVEDLDKGQDAQRREDHQEATDYVRRDSMPGEDGEAEQQQDDGDQDVRKVHDDFHAS